MSNFKVTIFTPTYNRAHLLEKLYTSLINQTDKDFEWIIVDDGSTDNTQLIVEKIQTANLLHIKYIYQNNGGKHRAINTGVSISEGNLFFIVDSDDCLVPEAVEIISNYSRPILNDDSYAGIIGVKSLFNGTPLVNCQKDLIDASTIDLHYRFRLIGDKAEVFKTDILRKFPFPDIPNEKFCSESLIWNRIANNYIMRFFNKSIYLCEYLEDGLSFNSLKLRANNPTYALLNYSESLKLNVPLKYKIKNILNFYRFKFHYKAKYKVQYKYSIPVYYSFLKPFAFLLYINDTMKLKK